VPWDLDLFGGLVGPLVVPETYQVSVIVRGDTVSGTVEVRKDPNSTGTAEEIRQQVALSLELETAITTAADLIDQAQWVRKQLGDATLLFADRKRQARELGLPADSVRRIAADDTVLSQVKGLEREILDVEKRLYDINLTGAREDAFRNPNQLFEKLASLASDVGASSADFRPTDQHREVGAVLRRQLEQVKTDLERVLNAGVAAYNAKALERGVPTISTAPPPRPVIP
jgi:hypothetical protein